MVPSLRKPLVAIALGAVLASCGQSREVGSNEYFSSAREQTSRSDTPGILGDSAISFGIGGKTSTRESDSNTGIGVNAYLWRATLDTLSFMPLVSADPFGGVIITDWWEPTTTPRERFKATAYILSRRLRSDGIKVSLFRQVEQNSQWVDAAVNPATSGELEDKILAHARELRAPIADR